MLTSTPKAMSVNGYAAQRARGETMVNQEFSDEDMKRMEAMWHLGMNDADIATIMGMSKDRFGDVLKNNAALRNVKDKGKANSNMKVLNSLYNQITREEVEKERIIIKLDANGNEVSRETKTVKARKDPNARLLQFYLQTRMGFTITQKIEHSGADGDPIRLKLSKMTDEELFKESKKLDIDE